jgi:hypothetical protein
MLWVLLHETPQMLMKMMMGSIPVTELKPITKLHFLRQSHQVNAPSRLFAHN